MTTYNWSSLSNVTIFGGGGLNPPSFNPFADTLHFDDPSITPASLDFSSPLGAASVFQYGGKYVFLDTPPHTLVSAPPAPVNVTFVGTGVFIYGDNTNTGPSPDDGANTLIGGPGDDLLAGGGGNDSLFGDDGNDRLLVTLDSTGTAYGLDTLNGGAGTDFVAYIDASEGVSVHLGNETANGGSIGGDGGSVLALIGIEGVIGTQFADTFNANSEIQVNGLRTDIVQRFEGGAGNDSLAGGMSGGFEFGLTIVAEYRNDPSGIIVNLDQQGGQALVFGAETIEAGTARDGYGDVDTLHNTHPGGINIFIDGIVGSMHDDVIVGGAFASSIGGQTRQIFEGLGGDDYIVGGFDFGGALAIYESSPQAVIVNLRETAYDLGGGDTIGAQTARDGFGGIDTLEGMDGARGSKHNDTLIGGTNDEEHFTGLGGNDYIDGGDDFDNAYYANAGEAVLIHLGAGVSGTARALDGTDEGGTIGVDELVEIEAAHGSDFNDSIVGGGDGAQGDEFEDVEPWEMDLFLGVEEFQGYAGHDIIDGGDSPGGASNPRDFALYRDSAGSVVVNLGTGTVAGVGSNQASDGFGGIDTLIDIDGAEGSRFDDTLIGGDGSEYFNGRQGNDSLDGGAGIDWIDFGSANRVMVDLGAGQATQFQGGSGGTTWIDTFVRFENVVGADGDDTIIGDGQHNVLAGFESDDTIVGGGGKDTIFGGDGDDTLNGGAGADSMIGGEGDDTYFVDNAGDRVVEAAAGGDDTVITSVSMALPLNIENIFFTGGAGIIITGNNQANIIGGGASNDTLSGGAGIDTVSYALANRAVTINLETNTATGYGNDVLSGFENATGGTRADTLIGNSGRNVLDGSGGADRMTGGFGNDTYVVDNVKDKVIETSNSTAAGALLLPGDPGGPALAGAAGVIDTVISAVNYSLATLQFVENLTLDSSAARATGNALANKLTGNGGNNILNGGAGNDTLDGKAGSDRLLGGTGNDTLVWGEGDTIDGGAGTDKLKVSDSLDLVSLENSALKGIETIDMNGGGNDTLTLNQQDVLDLSTTDTLTVLGNAGDVVSAAGFASDGVSGAFNRYTSGSAVLLVDQDLNVVA
jgi:Ca2+-binding RTX toxin-like protein